MKNLAYYNGKIQPISELKIPITDRAVYFGDGLYDVVHAVNQKIFALNEHIDRFYDSCDLLNISFGIKKDELKEIIQQLIEKENSAHQKIYWQVSRGSALRDHAFPDDSKPNLLIMVTNDAMKNMNKTKYNLILVEDTRFFHCNIKTLNLIPNVIASEKAKQSGCQEAVLHRGEYVTECAHSNIAILKDGVLKTAPLNNLILPGITRAHLIDICNKLNIPVVEKAFTIDELKNCDEAIVCASGSLFMGVDTLDGEKIGGKNSTLLKKLQKTYEQKIIDECGKSLLE